MPRNPNNYQQKQSEKAQKHANTTTSPSAIGLLTLLTTILNAQAVGAEAQRQFDAQSSSSATATNGDIRVDVSVESQHFSQNYCAFGDYFGCSQVTVSYTNTTTNEALYSLTFGLNLQSVKKTVVKDGQSHQENAASAVVLAYARNCLQNADNFINSFNATAATIIAQQAASQFQLPCSWTTSPNHDMYVTALTSNIAQTTCQLLQSFITGIVATCETDASKQAAKLYGLIALVAILIVPAVMAYSKYKEGSFFYLCKGLGNGRNEPTSSRDRCCL